MIRLLSFIGFLLSLYSIILTRNLKNKNYKPLCDISTRISCSKVFTNPASKLFGLHNSIIGIIYYSFIFTLTLIFSKFILPLSSIALIISIYLAYISYFKIKSFCIICSLIYLINILIFIISL